MRSQSKSSVLALLACGGLGAALTACNGSSNGPNGSSRSTAATTTPTTSGSTANPTPIGTSTTVAPSPAPSPSPVAAGTGQDSKFLFTCNYLSNDVSAYNVAATVGTLTSSVAAPMLTQSTAMGATASPAWLAADPSGSFLFVADSGTNAVDCFTIDRTKGTLTPPAAPAMSAAPCGKLPYAVLVDPTSKFVYTANLGDNTISAFMIQTGGSLAPCTTPSLVVGSGPSALAMDPTGKFLYVANTNDNTLSVCGIDATGNPSAVGTPIPTGMGPFSIASVNTGTGYVYVANNLDNDVSVFQIGAAGALKAPATGATVPIPNGGSGASVVTADPTGSYLYVLDGFGFAAAATNDIAAFAIAPATGALTPIGKTNTPAGKSPSSICVNASGEVLYVSDSGANAVLTFGITPGTGALVAEGSTPAGNTPTAICVSK